MQAQAGYSREPARQRLGRIFRVSEDGVPGRLAMPSHLMRTPGLGPGSQWSCLGLAALNLETCGRGFALWADLDDAHALP